MVDDPTPTEALTALVGRLRTELAGVRTAMRNRAVIEQAKGVLVERFGISPDKAFDHLVQLSQRANVKLIEVAAAIVGTRAPEPEPSTSTGTEGGARPDAPHRPRPAPSSAAPRPHTRPPTTEALQAQHQLLGARISAATSFDGIAEALGTSATGWPPPASVMLTALEPDGAQRMLGAYQLTADVRSQWARIPPDPGLVVVTAVNNRELIWLPDQQRAHRRFPGLRSRPCPDGAVWAAPLTVQARVLGGLVMVWDQEVADSPEIRHYLGALSEPVSRHVDRLLSNEIAEAWRSYAADPAPRRQVRSASATGQARVWLPAVLDTLLDPSTLLSPVHEGTQVVDFRIDYANAAARSVLARARVDAERLTLLSLYPGLGSTTLLPRLTRLLHGADPLRLVDLHVSPQTDGVDHPHRITFHAVRLWDRALLVFRVHSRAERLYGQLVHSEEAAGIGSFRYDPATRELESSPQLCRMARGETASEGQGGAQEQSITPEELGRCIHPDDTSAVRHAVRRILHHGTAVTVEFRGAGPLAGRRLHVTAVADSASSGGGPGPESRAPGLPVVVGSVQDVTAVRAQEATLRVAEGALASIRRRRSSAP